MILTKSIRGQSIWDVPKGTTLWTHPDIYDDKTFICWKACLNEFYGCCLKITEEQLRLLGGGDLKNGEQKWVDVNKEELENLGVETDFMSKNYSDWPERKKKL